MDYLAARWSPWLIAYRSVKPNDLLALHKEAIKQMI